MIPPEKLSARVAIKVDAPTFSKTVVNSETRPTYDMPKAVRR